MKLITKLLARSLALTLVRIALVSPAVADPRDYEFQLVQSELKQGDAVLAVRLLDKRTGRPVPDAIVFAKRIDMAPDGMEAMTSRIEQAATTEAGVYRFDVKLTMAGNWRLSLAAKVQGEPGTVETRLSFRAVK